MNYFIWNIFNNKYSTNKIFLYTRNLNNLVSLKKLQFSNKTDKNKKISKANLNNFKKQNPEFENNTKHYKKQNEEMISKGFLKKGRSHSKVKIDEDKREDNTKFCEEKKQLENNIDKIISNKNQEIFKAHTGKQNIIDRSEIKKMIKENDLIKKKVRSSGPGGQHVNKTSSAIFLKDPVSNISIKVGNSRDSIVNEGIAKKRLLDKLDVFYNGKESKIEKQREKMKKQKNKALKRSLEKHSNPKND